MVGGKETVAVVLDEKMGSHLDGRRRRTGEELAGMGDGRWEMGDVDRCQRAGKTTTGDAVPTRGCGYSYCIEREPKL